MAISYPLSFPTVTGLRSIAISAVSSVGASVSPLSFSQQIYEHPGETWRAVIEVPPLTDRATAAAWIAFLVKLNGRRGTFLMGDPNGATPRGSWAGVPRLLGAHAARAKTISIDGFTPGATGKEMDWLQFGSGLSTRLHQVVADFTADGAGVGTVEIWPGLREAQADNAVPVVDAPQGLWRLADNVRQWTLGLATTYGLSFTAVETL